LRIFLIIKVSLWSKVLRLDNVSNILDWLDKNIIWLDWLEDFWFISFNGNVSSLIIYISFYDFEIFIIFDLISCWDRYSLWEITRSCGLDYSFDLRILSEFMVLVSTRIIQTEELTSIVQANLLSLLCLLCLLDLLNLRAIIIIPIAIHIFNDFSYFLLIIRILRIRRIKETQLSCLLF
jgi:hypothetical protein